jgi:hypothetical protein
MPRWDREGGRIIETFFEAAAFQYTVKATCRCGHGAVFQPHALWWRFERKGWPPKLKDGAARFRCLRCAKGPVRLEPSRDPVTHDVFPLPPEHEWKRAVNRFRC